MVRRIACAVAVAAGVMAAGFGAVAEGAVPPASTGGTYTVRLGVDRTDGRPGQRWEMIDASGGRLRAGDNGFGSFFVMGNTGVDPELGDREGWRLDVPAGVRLTSFSVDLSTDSWVGRRWTSGLRYTLSATDASGAAIGDPFVSCEPTPDANDCPGAFRSGASDSFAAPAGTRHVQLLVECVSASGCSRFANPGGGPGGNEIAVIEGATLHFTDDTAPVLTTGSGELWTDPEHWFHNASGVAASMGAVDDSGVRALRWYVDGVLAYDTSGSTSDGALRCDDAMLRPCGDARAQFPLVRSLFALADGAHSLTVVALDAAGNVSVPLSRTFRVDDTPPPAVDAAVREGSGLRASGPWHLDFTVPSALGGSGVETAWYRLCSASNASDCTGAEAVQVAGVAPGDLATVAVTPPSQGDWNVRLWLGDLAGNASEASASAPVLIRYGQSAPVADPAAPPRLSGDFTDGQRVRVSASGFSDAAGALDYSFRWQRCTSSDACADIPGAVGQEYVLVHADAGRRVRAVVTGTNAKGSASATSPVSDRVAFLPPSHGRLALAGTPRAGEELTVSDASFDGTPPFSFSYSWLRCSSGACDPISGASGSAYTLRDEDVGQEVRVQVTAANEAGSSSALASADAPVAAAPPVSVAPPGAPTGEARVGRTLTASDGTWSGTRPMTFTYVWQRCASVSSGCTAITGADGRSYTLGVGDLGKVVRVLVTAHNGGDPVGPVASGRTGVVEAGEGAEEGPRISDPPATDPPPSQQPPASPPPPAPAEPSLPPAPSAGPEDLSKVPGNLVAAATCKVVRVTPRTRRAKLRGIGRVTFSATVPQRVTAVDPMRLSLRAKRRAAGSVTYRVGKRVVGRSRRAPFRVAVKPKALTPGGTQVLRAVVASTMKAKQRAVTMRLNVALCPSLLTAHVGFSGARAVTQLRVFSRTSIRGGSLTVPASLAPRPRAGQRAGTLRLTGAAGKPVSRKLVAEPGGRLLSRAGITVRRSGRTLKLTGLPAGTAIAQVDLFGRRGPALKLLRGRKPLRFTARVTAAAVPVQRLLATIKPVLRRRR
jgi:hypothetical protein